MMRLLRDSLVPMLLALGLMVSGGCKKDDAPKEGATKNEVAAASGEHKKDEPAKTATSGPGKDPAPKSNEEAPAGKKEGEASGDRPGEKDEARSGEEAKGQPPGKENAAGAEPGTSTRPNAEPKVPGPIRKLRLRYDEGVYPYRGKKLGRGQAQVDASSVLCEPIRGGQRCHEPNRLLDSKDATAWCEGVPGTGAGQTLSFDFGREREVTQIRLVPGYAKDRGRWLSNARLKRVELQANGQRFDVAFSNQTRVFVPGNQLDYAVPVLDFMAVQKRPLVTRHLQFKIRETYPGTRHEDLCLSEIAIYAR